jgi:hypothetical protein
MNKLISKIENDVQDRTSPAWSKLLEYVDIVHMEVLAFGVSGQGSICADIYAT